MKETAIQEIKKLFSELEPIQRDLRKNNDFFEKTPSPDKLNVAEKQMDNLENAIHLSGEINWQASLADLDKLCTTSAAYKKYAEMLEDGALELMTKGIAFPLDKMERLLEQMKKDIESI